MRFSNTWDVEPSSGEVVYTCGGVRDQGLRGVEGRVREGAGPRELGKWGERENEVKEEVGTEGGMDGKRKKNREGGWDTECRGRQGGRR